MSSSYVEKTKNYMWIYSAVIMLFGIMFSCILSLPVLQSVSTAYIPSGLKIFNIVAFLFIGLITSIPTFTGVLCIYYNSKDINKPIVWKIDIALAVIGLFFIVTLPVSIILLLRLFNEEVRDYYGTKDSIF